MPADVLAVFIKFRDFLVTLAPWMILALIAGAGAIELLRGLPTEQSRGRRALLIGAGLVFALPSIFGTLGFGLWLALTRVGFMVAAMTVASTVADRSERSLATERWLGVAEPRVQRARWTAQAKRLWETLGERFDAVGLWFIGACAVAGVIAVFVPYQVGFDIFGRTTWIGAVVGALIGTLIKRGTGMELPLASLLLLKGGGAAAAAALLFASTPLPFRVWRDGSRGWIAGFATVISSAAVGALAGSVFL